MKEQEPLGLNNKPGIRILLCFFLSIISVVSACYAVFALVYATGGSAHNVFHGMSFWDVGFPFILPPVLLVANGFMWFFLGKNKRMRAILLAFAVLAFVFVISHFCNVFVAMPLNG